MKLHDIDLNLLLVLERLLALRRVSAVAQALGLSQPAVSNALARLRRLLGDELFIRTARGMEPTPHALQLAEPVGRAMADLQAALSLKSDFNPSSSTRRFTLAMTDIGEIYFLPALVRELQERAPSVELSTVRTPSAPLRHEMESGQVDLAIGFLPPLRSGFFQRRLFSHRYVCLMRAGHPLARRRRLSLADFRAADHLVVQAEGTGHARADEAMGQQGVARRIKVTVPHFVAVGHMLQDSHLLATVPERLAHSLLEPFGLVTRAVPLDLPEIDIKIFWHARAHRDPGNQWLRDRVFELFADAGSTAPRPPSRTARKSPPSSAATPFHSAPK